VSQARRVVRTDRAFLPLFLCAAVFAALAVPLWLLQYGGLIAPVAAGAAAHAHEMVFGFALAVVGGYLLTRLSRARLIVVLGAWLAGRLVATPEIPPQVSAPVALVFPALLFGFAGLPFVRARRWRNAVFAIPLAGFFVAELVYQLGLLGLVPEGARRGVMLGVDLLALLVFTMGGRIIAAATSGALQRSGLHLEGLAQPRLEHAGVGTLLAIALLDVAGVAPWLAGLLAAIAAAIVTLRLIGWRIRRVMSAPEVSSLHLGYAWLALGLALIAAARLCDALLLAAGVHGITVGALGTLTLVMMVRVTLQRSRRKVVMPLWCLVALGLITLAAGARLAAVVPAWQWPAMVASGVAWTLAFAMLSGFLLRATVRSDGRS